MGFSCSNKPNEKEVLLYLSVRDDNYDIFKNDLEGTETRLTENPGFDYSPMWNETMKSIVYYSYVQDSFLIANMNLNGALVPLNTYKQKEFNLSPNGKKLVFQVSIGDFSSLVLSNTDGTEKDTITGSSSYNGRAKWSPTSDFIAYISDKDGNNEVYLYHLKDGYTRRLTNNDTNEKYIAWSPDGLRLAFTSQYYEEGKPDRNDVFVMDLASETITQITDNEFNDTELAWSPLSDRIAFHSTRNGQDHIFVMDSYGYNVEQVSKVDAYHGEPEWAVVSEK